MDLIKYIDNDGKDTYYSGSDTHDLYHYLDIIGDTTTLNYSYYNSHSFGTNTNKGSGSLNPVIESLRGIQRGIWIFVDNQDIMSTLALPEVKNSYLQVS